MKLLDKLEKKFGKFAIRNLMLYIVSINLLVYLVMYISPENVNIIFKLELIPQLVMHGEVWRLITYIFIPPQTSIIWILFTLYFYYIVGTGLEHEWGSFKFNVYYLIGIIGTTVAAFISNGMGSAFYLNLSLFLAFAFIYPNYQILLFFILPVKIKYLAWLDAAFMIFSFVMGDFAGKMAIFAAVLNFLLFFGRDIISHIKGNRRSYYNKRKYQNVVPKKEYFHKCTVCGITDKDDKDMDFRYCTSCEGHYAYCSKHLTNHEHK